MRKISRGRKPTSPRKNKGSFSIILLPHHKYCTGKFANHIPFISYDDINYKYILRGRRNNGSIVDKDFSDDNIIAEYDTIESLIND